MTLNREPAFPLLDSSGPSGLGLRDPGLTKRELFAAMAMQGLAARHGDFSRIIECPQVAEVAVGYADALLRELAKEATER